MFSPIPQVNNAGIVAKGTIETTSLESFDKVMRINTRWYVHQVKFLKLISKGCIGKNVLVSLLKPNDKIETR